MKRILDATVEVQYPPYLSDDAVRCISQLLERRPAHRLGNGPNGVEDIKSHPWFARVDWTKLEARRVEPPRLVTRRLCYPDGPRLGLGRA